MQLSAETDFCARRLAARNATGGRKSRSLEGFLCTHGAHVPNITGVFRETENRVISSRCLVERRGFEPMAIAGAVRSRDIPLLDSQCSRGADRNELYAMIELALKGIAKTPPVRHRTTSRRG